MILLICLWLVPFILAEPLTRRENARLQQICGKFKPPPPPANSTRARRHPESMNTPLATRFEAPFSIALRKTPYAYDSNPEEVVTKSVADCTGTLISSRHVITAAHCFAFRGCSNDVKPDIGDDLESKIFLTSTVCNASHTPVCDSNGYIRPSKLYISRAYVDNLCPNKTTNLYGDFAVIELEKDLPFSETVQPACLNTIQPVTGTTLLMFGYGRPKALEAGGVLRKLTTAVVSLEQCRNHSFYKGHDDEICSHNPDQIACRGDSGSGQVVIKENRAFLTGVLNYGPYCTASLTSDNFMDFSSSTVIHNPWVAAVTGVNPGFELSEEAKELLQKEYYEYTK